MATIAELIKGLTHMQKDCGEDAQVYMNIDNANRLVPIKNSYGGINVRTNRKFCILSNTDDIGVDHTDDYTEHNIEEME